MSQRRQTILLAFTIVALGITAGLRELGWHQHEQSWRAERSLRQAESDELRALMDAMQAHLEAIRADQDDQD